MPITCSVRRSTMPPAAWRVFPCWWPIDGHCACGDLQCESPAKHPLGAAVPHGFRDATTNTARIRRWWRRWPTANVAIATGRVSRIFVLDVDAHRAGDDTLVTLERQFGALPPTVTVQTPQGAGTTTSRCHRSRCCVGVMCFPASICEAMVATSWRLRGSGFRVRISTRSVMSSSDADYRSRFATAPAWLLDLIRSAPVDEDPRCGCGGVDDTRSGDCG